MHVKMKNRKNFQSHCFMLNETRNGNDERNFAFYSMQFGLNTDDISFHTMHFNVRKIFLSSGNKNGKYAEILTLFPLKLVVNATSYHLQLQLPLFFYENFIK